tara:strand:- start:322 stop:795 length:474 start_codon:yes stop_codon:yes gene_type:complete
MKNFICTLIISFILLVSCAKPTVVNVTLPTDNKLDCKKLEEGVDEAQKFRAKALSVTGNTPQNQARAHLFWPALMMTYLNASEAIAAANERTVHLVNIMQEKDCERLDKVLGHIASTPRVQTLKDLTEAYNSLLKLYEAGGLTDKEYEYQKRKVLGQ